MDSSAVAIVVSLIVAALGAIGGVAALLRVNSDNSSSVASGAKSISEGAKTVVDVMIERMDAQEGRMDSLEEYVSHFTDWADRLIDMLDRSITALPDALRTQFRAEEEALRLSRPKRSRATRVPETVSEIADKN